MVAAGVRCRSGALPVAMMNSIAAFVNQRIGVAGWKIPAAGGKLWLAEKLMDGSWAEAP